MAATAWAVYDQAKLKLGQKVINLGTDTFKCALFGNTTNVGSSSLATATYSAATGEIAATNGYATGGAAVSVTWTNSGGTETWGVSNPTWTPTGGGIVGYYAVLYDVTTGDLIAWSLLDAAGVNIRSLTIDSLGAFTLA